jgi:hypothetical protein
MRNRIFCENSKSHLLNILWVTLFVLIYTIFTPSLGVCLREAKQILRWLFNRPKLSGPGHSMLVNSPKIPFN